MRSFLVTAAAVAAIISAPGARAEGQTIGPFTINEIKVDGAHVGLLLSTTYSDNQCGLGNINHVALLKESPGFVQLYAAMLTAVSNGKRVGFWIDGCSTGALNAWGTRSPLVANISVFALP